MCSFVRPLGLAGLALLFACTVPAAPAFADPVTLIDGNYNGLTPPSTPVGLSRITFTTPADATFHPDQGVGGLAPRDLVIDLGFFSGPSTVPVTFATPLTVSNGSGSATFNLSDGLLTISSTNPFSGIVTATATYVSDTFGDAVDLSLFRLGGTGTFEADYTAIDVFPDVVPGIDLFAPLISGDPALAIWPAPDGASAKAHFELRPGVLTIVPEPASLALWGLAGLAGAGWRCRRRRKVR